MDEFALTNQTFVALQAQELAIGQFHKKDTPVILYELSCHDFTTRHMTSPIGGHYQLDTTHWLGDNDASLIALAYGIGGRYPFGATEIPIASTIDNTWQISSTSSATYHQFAVLGISDHRRSSQDSDQQFYAPAIARQLDLSPDSKGLVRLAIKWLCSERLGKDALMVRDVKKLSLAQPKCVFSTGQNVSLALFSSSQDKTPMLGDDRLFYDWKIAVRFETAHLTEKARTTAMAGLYRGGPSVTISLRLHGTIKQIEAQIKKSKELRLLLHLPIGSAGFFIIEVTNLRLSAQETKTDPATGLLQTLITLKGGAETSALTIYKAERADG